MRPGLFALLVGLLLVSAFQTLPKETTGQSTLTAESWTNLVEAFRSVQQADKLGAPSDEILQLSAELNTALEYYGNATQLLIEGNSSESDKYSSLSIHTSSSVMSKALVLQRDAVSQRDNGQTVAYLSAIIASVISAFLVIEYHRIPNYLRNRKLLKTRLR